jgi:hypothetical protein
MMLGDSGPDDTKDSAAPSTTAPAAPLRLVAWFASRRQRQLVGAAAGAGQLQPVAAVDILAPERLRELARTSLWLLLFSGTMFLVLDLIAWRVQHAGLLLGTVPWLGIVALVLGNIALYIVMLAAHEAVHAATILALGGRPRFGLRLPLAAYCTAPGQLFTRAGYEVVALAPLIVISLAGAVGIWLAPPLGAYLLFALAGNVSGAVGDLATVGELRALPSTALIADNATGFTAYVMRALE